LTAAGEGWTLRLLDDVLRQHEGVGDSWLHPAELSQLQRIANRQIWRQSIGVRLAAKSLLLATPMFRGKVPQDLAIVTPRRNGRSLPPRVEVDEAPQAVAISLSHTTRYVAAAVACSSRKFIGIDIVENSAAPDAWLVQWLSQAERALSASADGPSPSELWAAKEAAFKTLSPGTPFVPGALQIARAKGGSLTWRHENAPAERGDVTLHCGPQCVIALARRTTARVPSARREVSLV